MLSVGLSKDLTVSGRSCSNPHIHREKAALKALYSTGLLSNYFRVRLLSRIHRLPREWKSHELVWIGSTRVFISPQPFSGIAKQKVKTTIKRIDSKTCQRQAIEFIKKPLPKLMTDLHSRDRKIVKYRYGRSLNRSLQAKPTLEHHGKEAICRLCQTDFKTCLCTCDGLARTRYEILGTENLQGRKLYERSARIHWDNQKGKAKVSPIGLKESQEI